MGKSDRAIEIGDSLVTGKTGDSLAGNSTPGWCIASLVQESGCLRVAAEHSQSHH